MSLVNRFINYARSNPRLYKTLLPIVNKYADLAGYRKVGLVYDDLIVDETDVVQKALKRLPPRLVYDRMFRQRRAMQCSLSHTILPPHEQTKPEDDIAYLRPYIEEIEREFAERKELDGLVKSQ